VIPAGPSFVDGSADFVTWPILDFMLDLIAVNGDGELRHGIRALRVYAIRPEVRDSNRSRAGSRRPQRRHENRRQVP
jgi:hypothetical protein